MNIPTYWWFARFAQFALFLAIGIGLGMAVMSVFWPPFYGWLVIDEWHWTPFARLMRYGVLGGIGGVLIGAALTNYEWLVYTRASLLRKALVTVLVSLVCVAVIVFTREYVGRWLPG